MFKALVSLLMIAVSAHFLPLTLDACSTFKLQKGAELLYGHNLNQPGMNVPGMIFINRRGVFKTGRSFGEMFTRERLDPSGLSWISRYGSITFSAFGRDFPDGGINEAGLYIWEMNDDTAYPKHDKLPKLEQMNWMQYILDNFSMLDGALTAAHEIEIDGWGWHYFLGDAQGECAAVEFIQGEVVVHRGEAMPVPGLFNEHYAREVELSRYFKGFGGLYEPDLGDSKVPRFVKTAVMIRDFDPGQDAVAYGLKMLRQLTVNEEPKWSVLIDAVRKDVYFKTMANPEVKSFSFKDIDFPNQGPVLALNMDRKQGGDVGRLFHPATDEEIEALLVSLPLPDEFFQQSGITKKIFTERFTKHYHDAEKPERQFFRGAWKGGSAKADKAEKKDELTLELKSEGSNVSGTIRNSHGESYPLEHLHLIGDNLEFTFRNQQGTIFVAKAHIQERSMELQLWDIERSLGTFTLTRQ
jgi:penicillin V acylase-like amidase (Ntn superfamily)